MMYDPLWLLIHALSLCVRVLFTDAWQGDPAAALWSTLWRRIQRQYVPRHGNVHLPRRLYLQRSLSQEQVKSKLQSNRALNHWLVYSNPSLNVFFIIIIFIFGHTIMYVWCLNWYVVGWREKGHSLIRRDWFGRASFMAKQRWAWKCSTACRQNQHYCTAYIKHCMINSTLTLNCIRKTHSFTLCIACLCDMW